MWIWKMLQKKRQYSEEMYQRWVFGLLGLSISVSIWIITIIVSLK